jgi:hypothetical protein
VNEKTAREKLIGRCEAVDFDAMQPGDYGKWVNELPQDEFMALVAMHDEWRAPAVKGYRPQSDDAVQSVKAANEIEEHVLRLLDEFARDNDLMVDQRWLAIGRTMIEQGFMAVSRSVFKPGRSDLANAGGEPETGWVLERGDSDTAAPLYYAPEGGHGEMWSDDPDEALRFAREIDASRQAYAMGVQVRVCEHQWG